jgi:hypothetical protein
VADLTTLAAQIEASRRFTHSVGARTFALLQPTEHAIRTAQEDTVGAQGVIHHTRSARALLNAALVGWEGVTLADIDPSLGADALPFSTAAVPLLLDNNQDIADELGVAILRRNRERALARDNAAKN